MRYNKRFTAMQAKERHSLREYLMHVQGGRCYYCNCQMERYTPEPGAQFPPNAITFEHLVDEWAPSGKLDDVKNLVLACYECNNHRGQTRQMRAMELLYKTFPTKSEGRQFLQQLTGRKQSPRIRERLQQFGLLDQLETA